jgi:hypothetical protein
MMEDFIFDNMIDQYLSEKLSISDFLSKIPKKSFKYTDRIINLLEVAYQRKIVSNVELLIIAASADGVSSKYSGILCKLLKEDWHEKHEDIVMLLEDIKDPNTIDCIISVIYHKMPWDSDSYSSLGLKCIWALGAIGNKKAIEHLQELAKSDVGYIKDNALKQLQHISGIGSI